MEEARSHTRKLVSCSANTVTDLQKEDIRKAILTSIAGTAYYEGFENIACKAISNINKFSDASILVEKIRDQDE
ncbi:hypothetical protein KRX11_10140 [Pasteurellaceae bacterium TAE3-ERU1]|nr:hypothetical protein [Pasteurellaceae bacterium TAE3-ERU1]